MLKRFFKYFTVTEWALWLVGFALITTGFAVGKDRSWLSYLSSLAGITCIIFNAKGNVLGQGISIIFGILYGLYAYGQHYYGEMLIYFCLMIPIHIVSIITWLKNKFNGRAHEVKINTLRPREYIFIAIGVILSTVAFYFLLRALNTDNLIVSTISLTASLAAAYLMLRRCEFFSISFIVNDIILVILWSMKLPTTGLQVLPSVLAFAMYLAIDTYCFLSWRRIKRRQARELKAAKELKAESDSTERNVAENKSATKGTI